MTGRVELLRLLRRVRRRLRARGALQGAVFGGCAFLATWAVLLLVARQTGRGPSVGVLGAVAAAWILAGAIAGAARRIGLSRCARVVDRALGAARPEGEPRNGDRTFAALALSDGQGESAGSGGFAGAAVADALRAAGASAPAMAAPWRRPRGLGVAASLAAVTAALALWAPQRAPASAELRRTPVAAPRKPLDPALFTVDRRAADEATRRAAALGDQELGRLAEELRRVLAGLETGSVDRGEALERLARLAERAEAAARDGSALARGLRAAGEALAGDRDAAALAEAMRALDEQAAGKAARELAARAVAMGGKQREGLAEALSKAATASAAAGGQGERAEQAGGSQQRRLSSPPGAESAGGNAGQKSNDRQLKSLQRDLNNGAEACKEDPEACKKALAQSAANLPPQAREGQRSASRDRLARALEQMRDRLRRMDPADRAARAAEQEFEQAVGGGRPAPGGAGEGSEEGNSGATPGRTGAFAAGQGQGESAGAGQTPGAGPSGSPGSESGTASGAEGIGKEAGGDPLGPREGDPGVTRGEARQARVRSGAGPSRAEVIEAGARRGFARTEYHQVFEDYSAAVEESLDTTAVPPARRFLVRRYFELIRPRAPEPGGRP